MAKKKSIAELGALALKQLGSSSFYDKKAGPHMKRGRPSGSKNKTAIVLSPSGAITKVSSRKTTKKRYGGDLATLQESASIINKAKTILDGVGCITAFGRGHKKTSEPVAMSTGTRKKSKKKAKKGPGRPKKRK